MKLKNSLFLLLFTFTFLSYGQEWRDSIDVARTAYKNKEYDKALKYYESAQKKAPEDVDLSDEIAQSAYKARNFKKAQEVYQQGINSSKDPYEKADDFHNLGNAQMKLKDYEAAIESYKESLRNNPKNDQTRYNLSEAIRQLKNKQEQEKKDQQKKNQDKNKDNQGEENKAPGNNEQKNNPGNKDSESKKEPNPGNKIQNKAADKMLDKLMKQEAETKRKISGQKGKYSPTKSGKDW